MRRQDRKISNHKQILSIINRCEICNLAFFDEDYPYVIPLNFGVDYQNNTFSLYFHCANEGKKLDLMKQNPHVAFSMCLPKPLITAEKACNYTMPFESVCGNGTIKQVENNHKEYGLTKLMEHYDKNFPNGFSENALKAVTVLKLTVTQISGKQLKKD